MITLRQAGVTANWIAIHVNIRQRTVSKVWRRLIQTGSCVRRVVLDAQRRLYSNKTGCSNVLCSNNDSCLWELLTASGIALYSKWFHNQLPREGFTSGLCTVKTPEGNHSLVQTTDVLTSGGVPELHNGAHKITGPELSFRMNRDSMLVLMMDEFRYDGRMGQ